MSRVQLCSQTRCSSAFLQVLVLPVELVLLIRDLFEPVHRDTVEALLHRDMSHRSRRRGSMPMLHSGWNPNDIALANDLNRTTPLLYPANTVRHDQDLAERMGVPCRARARLESHCSAAGATWLSWIEERLHTNGTRKSLGGARNNVLRSGRRDRDLLSARLGSGNVIHHYRSQQEC